MSQPQFQAQRPQLSTVQVDAVIAEFEEQANALRSRCIGLRARCAAVEEERDALRSQLAVELTGAPADDGA